jgi:transposase
VAADLGVSRDPVRKWRGRFMVSRLEGLGDDPRPGAPGKITDEQVERSAFLRGGREPSPRPPLSTCSYTVLANRAGCCICRNFAQN